MTAPQDIFACTVGSQRDGHRTCLEMPRTPSCEHERVPVHTRSALVAIIEAIENDVHAGRASPADEVT